MAGNTHVIDSSESVIEISEVPLYPRKFKTIVEGEKVVCALNFDNLQFDYDKKNGLKMHGSFFQTDSIRFSTTYGDCSGCGISSQTYLGVKE